MTTDLNPEAALRERLKLIEDAAERAWAAFDSNRKYGAERDAFEGAIRLYLVFEAAALAALEVPDPATPWTPSPSEVVQTPGNVPASPLEPERGNDG